MKVYTIGYGGLKSFSDLVAILIAAKLRRCVLVDVRRNPRYAFSKEFEYETLIRRLVFGKTYLPLQCLGNRARKGEPVEFVGSEQRRRLAYERLALIAQEGKTLVFMCAEKAPVGCHRMEVVGEFGRYCNEIDLAIEVVHLRHQQLSLDL